MKKRIAHWLTEGHYFLHRLLDNNRVVRWAWDIEYPDLTEEERARFDLEQTIAVLGDAADRLNEFGAGDLGEIQNAIQKSREDYPTLTAAHDMARDLEVIIGILQSRLRG